MLEPPSDPIHPGEHLAESLDEYGLSQRQVARAMGIPPRRIREIIQRQRAISADTALRLGRFFGASAQFWLNLPTRHDLEQARNALGERLEREIVPLRAA